MSTPRARRTIPCVRCRDKHLKCDGQSPCSNCREAIVSCERVKKSYRFKHVNSGAFTLHVDPVNVSDASSQPNTSPDAVTQSLPDATYDSSKDASSAGADKDHRYSERGENSGISSFWRAVSDNGPVSPLGDRERPRTASEWQTDSVMRTSDESELKRGRILGRDNGSNFFPGQEGSPRWSATSTHLHIHHPAISTSTPLRPLTPKYGWHDTSEKSDLHQSATLSSHDRHSESQNAIGKILPPIEHINAASGHENESRTFGRPQTLGLQESCLVRCFVKYLAHNFDASDRMQCYVHVLPIRALHCPLLLNAICAAAARFLTHKGGNSTLTRRNFSFDGIPLPDLNKESAIHYHNACIRYLTASDNFDGVPKDNVLAAITVLRYHEQVDSHLTKSDPETYLNAVKAIFSTGSERLSPESVRLFTSTQPGRLQDEMRCSIYDASHFALRRSAYLIALRQEIWSVLLYRRPFRLPVWSVELLSDWRLEIIDDFDWTNRIILFCAHTLIACFGADDLASSCGGKLRQPGEIEAVRDFIAWWDGHVPPEFRPLRYEDPDPRRGTYFPIIWQSNDCQVLGLQHLELARIILTVHDDRLPRLGPGAAAAKKSVEEQLRQCVRQICGLAWSKPGHQSGMVTAAVGISLCGEYLVDPGEREAVLKLLDILAEEHSWPTSNIVATLQQAWQL